MIITNEKAKHMSEKKLTFLYSPSKEILVAANPQTNRTIILNQEKSKWFIAPRDYSQMMGDSTYNGEDWEEVAPEKAKNIYKDIQLA
jgi:hypothetical protein